jgi:hypothetical protein
MRRDALICPVVMRQSGDSRRCIPLERLFLQAANEKEDRHSITERSCQTQQKFRPKKATRKAEEKTSRVFLVPMAPGVDLCQLMLKF